MNPPQAVIALAGPIAGSAAAAAVGVAGVLTGSQFAMGLADFGLMINLFNLLPIGQLDGGRVANSLSPWLGVAGLVGGGAIMYVTMTETMDEKDVCPRGLHLCEG